MKSDYKQHILNLFTKRKVAILGETIVSSLVVKFNIKRDTARKILSLAVKEKILFSSAPLRFQHGQFAYSNINNKSSFNQLLSHRPGIKGALSLLSKTSLPENEIIKIAQSIYTSSSSKDAVEKLITDINVFNPVLVKTVNGCRFYYLKGHENDNADNLYCKHLLSIIKKDAAICRLVYSYLKTINLISDGIYRTSDAPWELVGDYYGFDLIGYSTLGGARNKTTFLFDVRVSYNASKEIIKRFIRRIKAFKSKQANGKHNYLSKVIGVVVVRDIDNSLRNAVDSQNNLLWIGLRQIFGKSIDSFLWLVGQDTQLLKSKELDESFYEKFDKLASSDFSNLLSNFLDDYFEMIVNSCIGKLIGKPFFGRTIPYKGATKEFDGFYEDNDVVMAIESKNLGKSMIKWHSEDSGGRLDNDCLEYFFDEKVNFLKNAFPNKKIYACYVSKSGYSKRNESENKINNIEKIPVLKQFLLTPGDLVKLSSSINKGKEFEWLEKMYIKKEE